MNIKRELKIDGCALIAFTIGTLMLFLGESVAIRALGALPHYFGAMVIIARTDNWGDYLRALKRK